MNISVHLRRSSSICVARSLYRFIRMKDAHLVMQTLSTHPIKAWGERRDATHRRMKGAQLRSLTSGYSSGYFRVISCSLVLCHSRLVFSYWKTSHPRSRFSRVIRLIDQSNTVVDRLIDLSEGVRRKLLPISKGRGRRRHASSSVCIKQSRAFQQNMWFPGQTVRRTDNLTRISAPISLWISK